MSFTLRLFIVLAGLALEALVIHDLAKQRMTEKQCLFWLFSGVILIFAGAIPELTFLVAKFFGVDYAPSIVFAIAILLAIYGIYRCFATNAALMHQMTELVEQVSLLRHEVEMLKKNGQK